MTGSPVILLLIAIAILSGCEKSGSPESAADLQSSPDRLTAATLGDQVVLPARDYLQMPRYRDADFEYGQRLAMQCRACHSFDAGGPNLTGPNLHGFFGKRVGSVERYDYSPALEAADFIWTPEALDAWLAQPATFLPGNRMIYLGLNNPAERDAIVSALLQLTGNASEAGE